MVIGMMMLIMMTKVAMIMIIEGETTEDKFPWSVYLISLDLPVPPQDLSLQLFLSKNKDGKINFKENCLAK